MEQESHPSCRTLVGSRAAGALSRRYLLPEIHRNDKRVWQRVGRDPDRALAALRNTEHDLHGAALGRRIQNGSRSLELPKTLPKSEASLPIPVPTEMLLTEAIAAYMAEVRRFRSPSRLQPPHSVWLAVGSSTEHPAPRTSAKSDVKERRPAWRNSGYGIEVPEPGVPTILYA
jgi:hypothetical protein